MEALAVWYLIVVVVAAAMAAGVARRRGQALSRVRLVFVLEALGLIVVGYGLLALMFNGYIEGAKTAA